LLGQLFEQPTAIIAGSFLLRRERDFTSSQLPGEPVPGGLRD
jgi:hypothetical protein